MAGLEDGVLLAWRPRLEFLIGPDLAGHVRNVPSGAQGRVVSSGDHLNSRQSSASPTPW